MNLPRWLDLDVDGKPIDAVGIAPDVVVDAAPKDFTSTSDPVLERALVELRKTPERARKAGKR